MVNGKPIKALCGIRENRLFSHKGNVVCVNDKKLTVRGMYSCEIPFSSIESCSYKNRIIGGKVYLTVKNPLAEKEDLIFNFSNAKKAKLIFKIIESAVHG